MKLILLLKENGVNVESPYDVENWWEDNFSHTEAFKTGLFKEE